MVFLLASTRADMVCRGRASALIAPFLQVTTDSEPDENSEVGNTHPTQQALEVVSFGGSKINLILRFRYLLFLVITVILIAAKTPPFRNRQIQSPVGRLAASLQAISPLYKSNINNIKLWF